MSDETVQELLAQQARLRGWIDLLGEPGDDVPAHVAARVRADYEGRLADLVARLASHRDAVLADLERLRAELRVTLEGQEAARDALAEARLRNRLGEWSGEEWEERRAELEQSAAAATERAEAAAERLLYLEQLLAEIEPAEAGDEPISEPEPEPAAPGEDYSFLDGVDSAAPGSPEPDTRPGPGIKCPDCGYTNDSTAWYCGVCGLSLA